MISLKQLRENIERLKKSEKHSDGKYHASMIAVFVGPEMLFTRRNDSGLLSRPGGHAEPGEDSLSAAIRELWEETGIKVNPEQLKHLGSKETVKKDGSPIIVSGFKLILKEKPQITFKNDPDKESSEVIWSEPSKISDKELHHKPDIIRELLKTPSLKELRKSLEKGLRGDWQKEGYIISHVEHPEGQRGFKKYTVSAKDKEGNLVGEYIFSHFPHQKNVLIPDYTFTNKEHRRKGIASAAYNHIEKVTGRKVANNPEDRTADAEKLWSNPNRSFGKSIENDLIPGGLSDKKSDKDFNPKKIKQGIKVELEHTSNPKIAKEIAQDHLTEDKNYYNKLKTIEKSKLIKSTPHADGKYYASSVMVKHGDELLFLRRKDSGKLTKPGGHAEPGENAHNAAQRELFEETGIKAGLGNIKFLGKKECPRHGGGTTVVSVYQLDLNHKPQVSFDNDPDAEASEALWIKPDAINQQELHHNPDVGLEMLKKVFVEPHNVRAASHIGVGKDIASNGFKNIGHYSVNGLKVHVHRHEGDPDEHIFEVKGKTGKTLGVLYTNSSSGLNLGSPDEDGHQDYGPQSTHSFVDPKYRGKGIGRALYTAAINHHGELFSSNALSPHSHKMWQNTKKIPGVKFTPGKQKTNFEHHAQWGGDKLPLKLSKNMPIVSHEGEIMEKDMPAHPPAEYRAAPKKTSLPPHIKAALASIESSGGRNRLHDVVNAGIHKGTRAVSSYGLMPKMIIELAQKYKPFAESVTGKKVLAAKSPEEVSEITKNFQHDDEAMRHLWKYNQSRIQKFAPKGADLELLGAYAHRRGVMGTFNKLQNEGYDAIANDEYVQKYKKYKENPIPFKKRVTVKKQPEFVTSGIGPTIIQGPYQPTQKEKSTLIDKIKNLFKSGTSLNKLHKAIELLEKAKKNYGGVWVPETEGEEHPERPQIHAVKSSNFGYTWAPKPHIAIQHEKNLTDTLKQYGSYLPKDKQESLYKLYQHVMNDPERHFIGNTGNEPKLRLRHLHNALRANSGYSLNFDGDKILISANRHSGSNKTINSNHNWTFDKNGLKFSGSQPISSEGGNDYVRKSNNKKDSERNRHDDSGRMGNILQNKVSMGALHKSGGQLSRRSGVFDNNGRNDNRGSKESSKAEFQKGNIRNNPTFRELQDGKSNSTGAGENRASNGERSSFFKGINTLKKSLELMNKALDPKDWNRISKAHYANGENTVTAHEPETDHNEYHSWQVSINRPDIVKRKPFKGTGISTKMIHEQPDWQGENQTIMVKPYHQKPRTDAKLHAPLAGWSTITNRDLYHAGNIPHLVENVHVSNHKGVPVTVHKFNRDVIPHNQQRYLPKNTENRNKIAILDYLTDNQDRHSGNLMWLPSQNDSEDPIPLAIDHERSFQYVANPYRYEDRIGGIVRNYGIYSHNENYSEQTPEAKWWEENADNIKNSFYKNLEKIKDPQIRERLSHHFDMRHDQLNHWAAGNTDRDLGKEQPYYDEDDGYSTYLKQKAKSKK